MQMRNKKRVFYGDHRPSMMERHVEPVAEKAETGDGGGGLSPPKANVGARPSTTFGVPTLNVPGGDENEGAKNERTAKSRSVFGVDTVWEREMAKLKAIQEAEKKATTTAEMERLAREREKIEKADRRRSRFLKSKSMMADPNAPHFDLPNPNRMSLGIPDLAAGPGEKRITMFGDNRLSVLPPGARNSVMPDAHGDDGEGGEPRPPTLMFNNDNPDSPGLGVENWFESSSEDSDDDNIPLSSFNPSVRGSVAGSVRAMSPQATRNSQGRPPVSPAAIRVPPPPQLPVLATDDDESSDEDVPLSKVKATAHDSDEEVPLSRIRKGGAAPAPKTEGAPEDSGPATGSTMRLVSNLPDAESADKDKDKPALSLLPETSSFGLELQNTLANISPSDAKDEDDDDIPLYLRRQKAKEEKKKEQTVEEIEDDLPLAWKHANAAQKQASQRAQTMAPSMNVNPYASVYMSGYGMPGMPMGGMGPMGMGGMGHMSMMMPNMGMPPNVPYGPAPEVPDPGSNIDNWRKQVGSLAPAKTGTSGQTL